MVRDASRRLRRKVAHACLLTRLPAAIRPRSLKQVIEQLRAHDIAILPTVIIEKDAFRALFALGGGLSDLERSGVYGVGAAKINAASYVDAVIDLMEGEGLATGRSGGESFAAQPARV
jgi:chromosome partitioning protein